MESNMNLTVKTEGLGLKREAIEAMRPEAGKALDRLWSGKEDMTGWVQTPINQSNEELEYILNVADVIKAEAELLVVVGIGGSYLGAKAAIEALPKVERGAHVRFFGTNFCTDYYRETIEEIKNKNTIICVISKSGNTTEIKAAFDTLKPLMEEKYRNRVKKVCDINDKCCVPVDKL